MRTLAFLLFPALTFGQTFHGSLDIPQPNSPPFAGAINVAGWAISTNTISRVSIYRNPLAGEQAGSNGLVYIQDGAFIAGSRPDVAGAYPGYPNNNWGWGTLLLSNTFRTATGTVVMATALTLCTSLLTMHMGRPTISGK